MASLASATSTERLLERSSCVSAPGANRGSGPLSRAARAFCFEVQADIEASLERGDDISTRQFTLSRLSLNYATSAIAEAVTFAYKYSGGLALRAGTLQRLFRDMYSGTQHITTGPNILRECGKELIGFMSGKVWGPRGLTDPIQRAGSLPAVLS